MSQGDVIQDSSIDLYNQLINTPPTDVKEIALVFGLIMKSYSELDGVSRNVMDDLQRTLRLCLLTSGIPESLVRALSHEFTNIIFSITLTSGTLSTRNLSQEARAAASKLVTNDFERALNFLAELPKRLEPSLTQNVGFLLESIVNVTNADRLKGVHAILDDKSMELLKNLHLVNNNIYFDIAVREVLTNALKADSSHVIISCRSFQDNKYLLVFEDDGVGFEEKSRGYIDPMVHTSGAGIKMIQDSGFGLRIFNKKDAVSKGLIRDVKMQESSKQGSLVYLLFEANEVIDPNEIDEEF